MKTTLKLSMLALLTAATLSSGFAQRQKVDTDVMGTVVLKNGDEVKAYIRLDDGLNPWNNQKEVKYYLEKALADGKIKGKEVVTLKPKEVQKVIAGEQVFVPLKLSVAKLVMGVGLSKMRLVERIHEGNINYYKVYDNPGKLVGFVNDEMLAQHERDLEEARNNPIFFIEKEKGDYKNIRNIKFSEYVSDCDNVIQKLESGHYGFEEFNSDASTKVGKLIANNHNGGQLENAVPLILEDYDNCK